MIKKRPTWKPGPKWTVEEDNILKNSYGIIDVRPILSNHTWTGIKIRAAVLGIRTQNRPRNLRLSLEERCYIAGILDGEGSIGFNDTNAKDRKKSYLAPYVKFINTNTDLIDWLDARFIGLDHSTYKKNDRTIKQKECWEISIGGPSSVQALLELLYPYLIIRKKRAELMMQYTSSRVGKGRRDPYTVEPRPIAEEIRRLNHTGRETVLNN